MFPSSGFCWFDSFVCPLNAWYSVWGTGMANLSSERCRVNGHWQILGRVGIEKSGRGRLCISLTRSGTAMSSLSSCSGLRHPQCLGGGAVRPL